MTTPRVFSFLCLVLFCLIVHETGVSGEQLPERHQLVVYAINGLTAEMAMARHMPTMAKVFQQGGITAKMRTTYATRSPVANWIGIFHGASSVEYGCDNNGCNNVPRMDPSARSLVAIMENNYAYETQVFSEDGQRFNEMLERDEDVNVHSHGVCSRGVFEDVMTYAYDDDVVRANRTIILVNIMCLDNLGESDGYGLENYVSRVLCLDKELASMTKALWQRNEEATTFIMVANHGGLMYNHGQFNLDTIAVPFAVWGYGFRRHASMIGEPTTTQEIAPTLFKALNIEESASRTWLERAITSNIYSSNSTVESARYSDIAELAIPQIDEEECDVVFTIRHGRIRDFYVSVRIIVSVLIIAFAISMFH